MKELIKKFEEYTLDIDGGEIAEEYAKLILSTYIDKKDGESLESVYKDIIVGDQLDEDQAYIIKNTLQDYLYTLFDEAKDIRKILDIESTKYNL